MMIKILKHVRVKVDNIDENNGEFQQRHRNYKR